MPTVPYPYEVNGKLVIGNGSLMPKVPYPYEVNGKLVIFVPYQTVP